jgi:hypothetical protein
MEAKVDIRKLQLLNDRITQTIEALNQVRLSVHGLTHTPGLPATIPFTPQNVPFAGFGLPMTPNFPAYPGFIPGLQHTPFTPVTPFSPVMPITPFALPNVPGYTPLPFMSGLSHTSPEGFEQKAFEFKPFDPYRMVQTFPYLNTPYWNAPYWQSIW